MVLFQLFLRASRHDDSEVRGKIVYKFDFSPREISPLRSSGRRPSSLRFRILFEFNINTRVQGESGATLALSRVEHVISTEHSERRNLQGTASDTLLPQFIYRCRDEMPRLVGINLPKSKSNKIQLATLLGYPSSIAQKPRFCAKLWLYIILLTLLLHFIPIISARCSA